jgi:hypothetical protein
MAKRRKGEAADNVALAPEERTGQHAMESTPQFNAELSDAMDDEIAARAYEIYRERGGTDGRALDDWLQAERELSERRGNLRR